MPSRFRALTLLLGTLLVGAPASAQKPGDVYGFRREMRIDSVTATHVFYQILISTSTPATVGRHDSMLKTNFLAQYGLLIAASSPTPTPTPAPTPTPPAAPPVPPPPAQTGTLCTATFEDGTLGQLHAAGNNSNLGSQFIDVVDDPTGQFGGKVARIHFVRGGTGASPDVNRSFDCEPPTTSFGQSIYFGGDILIPTQPANMAGAQRKLIYWQTSTNQSNQFAVKHEDGRIKFSTDRPASQGGGTRVTAFPGPPLGKKFRLEVLVIGNSAPQVADGTVRIWVDGALRHDRSDYMLFADQAPWRKYKIGQQTQHIRNDRNVLFNEWRYFDNVIIARARP